MGRPVSPPYVKPTSPVSMSSSGKKKMTRPGSAPAGGRAGKTSASKNKAATGERQPQSPSLNFNIYYPDATTDGAISPVARKSGGSSRPYSASSKRRVRPDSAPAGDSGAVMGSPMHSQSAGVRRPQSAQPRGRGSGGGAGGENGDDAPEVVYDSFLLETRKQSKYKPESRKSQLNKMNSLSRPRSAKKKVVTNGVAKTSLDWVEHQAKQSPGPGQYDLDKTNHKKLNLFGKFQAGRSKSTIDIRIAQAAEEPGPGEYNTLGVIDREKKKSGVRFGSGNPKTDIEWRMYEAAKTPGPGSYKIDSKYDRPAGGHFNTSNPKGDVEWKIYNSGNIPGPGQYELPTAQSTMKGGKFSTANPKSDIDWQIYEAARSPGPGSYNIGKRPKDSSMKFNTSKPKTDIEWKIYEAAEKPGPGQYKVPSTLDQSRGKFPFVYRPTEPELQHLRKD